MITNTITIEKIINGGFGLGRAKNGQIILTRGSLPGEKVKYSIVEKKKNFIQGKVQEILESHAQRREAPCQYYGQCGGCDLQHCHYSYQLTIKDSILYDLMERQGIPVDKVTMFSCLPSPKETGYRQRIRLTIDSFGQPGFLHFRSSKVVPISNCLIAHPTLNLVLNELQEEKIYTSLATNCRELELLLNPHTGGVASLFHLNRKPRPRDFTAAEDLMTSVNLLENIFFKGENFPLCTLKNKELTQTKILRSELVLPHMQTPLPLTWEVGGFCQVNIEQNNRLVAKVLDMAKPDENDTLLDLYCGMGNFSVPLAKLCGSLLGVEGQASSIRCAKSNSSLAGLTNTKFIKSPIHTFCDQLEADKNAFDLVITDPPRQGIPGLSKFLATITRKRLVYISCDPATLCRDLKELGDNGLSLKAVQPVDMFPQTHHIETVALLEKN
jgi:23S rRNA (uracil1939-C5)-methyltransferase